MIIVVDKLEAGDTIFSFTFFALIQHNSLMYVLYNNHNSLYLPKKYKKIGLFELIY